MANLNEFIGSIGSFVLVGCIIVGSIGVTTYFGYSVKNNLSEQQYDTNVFNQSDPMSKNYAERGGTKRKKNKSRKK